MSDSTKCPNSSVDILKPSDISKQIWSLEDIQLTYYFYKFTLPIYLLISDQTVCLWLECNYTASSLVVLAKHVCFHGYHHKLKNIGENVLERVKLPKCTQVMPFIVPNTDYICEWDNCSNAFLAVQEFLDHIKLHINSNPKYCKKGEFIKCCWAGNFLFY